MSGKHLLRPKSQRADGHTSTCVHCARFSQNTQQLCLWSPSSPRTSHGLRAACRRPPGASTSHGESAGSSDTVRPPTFQNGALSGPKAIHKRRLSPKEPVRRVETRWLCFHVDEVNVQFIIVSLDGSQPLGACTLGSASRQPSVTARPRLSGSGCLPGSRGEGRRQPLPAGPAGLALLWGREHVLRADTGSRALSAFTSATGTLSVGAADGFEDIKGRSVSDSTPDLPRTACQEGEPCAEHPGAEDALRGNLLNERRGRPRHHGKHALEACRLHPPADGRLGALEVEPGDQGRIQAADEEGGPRGAHVWQVRLMGSLPSTITVSLPQAAHL
ncbi:uncharacterized protein LOC116658390 isoform X2 [Camelus ferus]|uniref:Uncharacterized protein LOC116658390 isoform X2 n=1 Tax=Camelus ferus TaxID=419612 RepID=A0A8B8RNA4_CAMFR|nr:uncharacterized protein LOC116658390 isoform X2 [Camelus ferus]